MFFYRPRYGNYQHWTLYLECGDNDIIFEAVGQHPDFKRNIIADANPKVLKALPANPMSVFLAARVIFKASKMLQTGSLWIMRQFTGTVKIMYSRSLTNWRKNLFRTMRTRIIVKRGAIL